MKIPLFSPLFSRYTRWLHTRWPAGVVEKLPVVGPGGATSVPGVHVVGDLTGIPLLKFSTDSGARAVQTIAADPAFARRGSGGGALAPLDIVIIGGGVSGMSAALEARKLSLSFCVLEASEPFSTVVNFPRAKPIYTYPTQMVPAGELRVTAQVKEPLVEELRAQTIAQGISPRMERAERVTRHGGLLDIALAGGSSITAHRVIVAIGRSGNFRRLGVPGEDSGKVFNRLHDPRDFAGSQVLVVGGGDSALETAIAVAQCGGHVTLSYRKPDFSRPKPENVQMLKMLAAHPDAEVAVEKPVSERITTSTGRYLGPPAGTGSIKLMLPSHVKEIRDKDVVLADAQGATQSIPNDAVFSMLGREAPLDFFRRSGIRIRGEWSAAAWAACAVFTFLCIFIYNWKAGGALYKLFEQNAWFPFNLVSPADPSTLAGTLRISMRSPGFWYSLAYTLCIVCFGAARIRRRRTPYVTLQTWTLIAVQVLPLFLLPYLLLPWMGHTGWFDDGAGRWLADHLFPATQWDEHGREYWRAFGLVLAWPLFFWNVFSAQPLVLWLVISVVQTLILIPLLIYFFGKGAYCGWICSCGALAETMGDTHRQKMPHGPFWNRLNMVGQAILAAALVLLAARIWSWVDPQSWAGGFFEGMLQGWNVRLGSLTVQLNYRWIVDVGMAGILGVAGYFWFSGRVWCRFACPLAALMHIYARFSRFGIVSEKKKCISCNACTSVCHQGIDVMNFANKGLPMVDPQCVRCSACVQTCPTGVLSFGQIQRSSGALIRIDRTPASPVQMAEGARAPTH